MKDEKRVKAGKMSRNKGKVGEREVVAMLKEYEFEARRGQQFRGGDDSPDIIHDICNVHIEVKRTEQFNLYKAMEQAGEDKESNERPVIFHRKNGRKWMVVLEAEHYLLLEQLYIRRMDGEFKRLKDEG
jgi:Holliday junction resolvase